MANGSRLKLTFWSCATYRIFMPGPVYDIYNGMYALTFLEKCVQGITIFG